MGSPVASYLPVISYLTVADRYVMACFAAVVTLSIFVGVEGKIASERGWSTAEINRMDSLAAVAFVVLFALMNAFYYTRLISRPTTTRVALQ